MADTTQKETAKARVRRRGWLTILPESFGDELLREALIKRYSVGEYTYHIGDEGGGVYGVAQGSFAVLGNSPSMSGTIMGHVIHVGDWFGEGPLIMSAPRMLEYRALEPAVALYVPLPVLRRMIEEAGRTAQSLGSMVAYNSEIATRAMADLLIRRADQRLAAVLLRVCGVIGAGTAREQADCAISQSEIAEMANVSRHTANVVLQRFQKDGWVEVGYRVIRIRNISALSKYLISQN